MNYIKINYVLIEHKHICELMFLISPVFALNHPPQSERNRTVSSFFNNNLDMFKYLNLFVAATFERRNFKTMVVYLKKCCDSYA